MVTKKCSLFKKQRNDYASSQLSMKRDNSVTNSLSRELLFRIIIFKLTNGYFHNTYHYYSDMFNYITEEGKTHMQKFQYKGICDSLTYKHLWSPFGEYLLQYVPESVAPNTITAVAFAILVIAHILFMSGAGQMQAISTWRLVTMAVAILLYQHLDNLDGKQARKTKTSSPLGMLFDHGADALSTFMLSLQMLELLHVPNPYLKILTMSGMVMLAYFCIIWSQYSVGYFKLGSVNPVDQGLPGYAIFALINIFLTPDFWNSTGFYLKNNEITLLILLGIGIMLSYSTANRNYKEAIRPISEINQVLLLPLSYGIVIAALFYSEKCPFQTALWPFYYIFMFSWCRNMIMLQLFYVTKQKFNPFNIGSLSFIISSLLYFFIDCDPYTYFLGVAILQGVLLVQFVVSAARQSAEILQINIFSIKVKNK